MERCEGARLEEKIDRGRQRRLISGKTAGDTSWLGAKNLQND